MLRRALPAFRPLLRARYNSSLSSLSSLPALNLAPEPKAPAQSPNVPTPWSKDQQPKAAAYDRESFEQIHFELQPDGLSAMGLVAEERIVKIAGRRAVCDGGGGALGHPKIFINLDKPGARACGYCGTRYEMEHHH